MHHNRHQHKNCFPQWVICGEETLQTRSSTLKRVMGQIQIQIQIKNFNLIYLHPKLPTLNILQSKLTSLPNPQTEKETDSHTHQQFKDILISEYILNGIAGSQETELQLRKATKITTQNIYPYLKRAFALNCVKIKSIEALQLVFDIMSQRCDFKMEARAMTSRSIDFDQFREREINRKYKQHLDSVKDIVCQKSHPILEQMKEIKRMEQSLKKSKQQVKTFQQGETDLIRKRQNKFLLEKIWKANSQCKNHIDQKGQYITGSNWYYRKQRSQSIKQENRKLATQILSNKCDLKDYKKKMESEIKEYLELRNHVRKFKLTSTEKGLKRSKSESKKISKPKLGLRQDSTNNQETIQQHRGVSQREKPKVGLTREVGVEQHNVAAEDLNANQIII